MEHLVQKLEAMETLHSSISLDTTNEDVSSGYVSGMESSPEVDLEVQRLLQCHLSLLTSQPQQHELGELVTTPIFTMPVLEYAEVISPEDAPKPFPQYGLLAGMRNETEYSGDTTYMPVVQDPRIFFNVAAPSSTFICGSQGSGKSHTLSCLLENCLPVLLGRQQTS
jgi:hypothetical protein